MVAQPIDDASIGFVGLGTMGLPMAKNAVAAGFSVRGFDVRAEPRDALVAAGGEAAADLNEVADNCRVVSVVVETAAQVEEVLAGPDGLFEGLAADGGIVLIHSTVHPETPATLAEAAPAGVTVLNAPVSGMRTRAETANLSFMVGGPEEAVGACRPLFEAMGTSVHHVGDVGSGEVVKLANNLVSISNMMTTAEGIALGTEWGVDRDTLLDVMADSSAESFVLDHWEFLVEGWGDVQPGGYDGVADICAKDLDTALDLARTLDLDVPGTAVASQQVPAFYRERAGDH